MQEFIEAIFYKNNNDISNYQVKLLESASKNFSLAYYELAIITSNKTKAQKYFHICVSLISDEDIELAKQLNIELEDLDHTLFNELIDDLMLNMTDIRL